MKIHSIVGFFSFVFASNAFAESKSCTNYSLEKPEPFTQSQTGWEQVYVDVQILSDASSSQSNVKFLETTAFGPAGTELVTYVWLFPDVVSLEPGQVLKKAQLNFLRRENGLWLSHIKTPLAMLPKVTTAADFYGMTKNQKNWVIESFNLEDAQSIGIEYFECQTTDLRQISHLPLVAQILNFVDENIYLEVDTDLPYVKVGDLKYTISWIRTPSGEFVGSSLRIFQNGGMVDDDYDGDTYFATEDEARAAGVDLESDVSWSAFADMFWDGKTITSENYSEILEWSGH